MRNEGNCFLAGIDKSGDFESFCGMSEAEHAIGPPPLPGAGKPWGIIATSLWALAIIAVYLGVQWSAAGILFAVIGAMGKSIGDADSLAHNGLFLSVLTLVALPVVVIGCVGSAFLRKGIAVRDYLGFKGVSLRAMLPYVAAFLVLLLSFDLSSLWLDRSVVTQFMLDVYESAGSKPLLWLTLLVGAPVGEELFFRGFLLAGFRTSRLGATGAVVLTSLLWAGIHTQYDPPDMAMVFLTGMALGWVRLSLGSIVPCIALHALMNFLATLEVLAEVGVN
jgi:membrane protease YdiL (CAAX protease family)